MWACITRSMRVFMQRKLCVVLTKFDARWGAALLSETLFEMACWQSPYTDIQRK